MYVYFYLSQLTYVRSFICNLCISKIPTHLQLICPLKIEFWSEQSRSKHLQQQIYSDSLCHTHQIDTRMQTCGIVETVVASKLFLGKH